MLVPNLSDMNFEQLEHEGYTVVSNFLDRDTTSRLRNHIDTLLSPLGEPHDETRKRWHAVLRHPIPGSIMADVLNNPALFELAKQCLQSSDLRLLEQVLIRSDPSPPPHRPHGWHVDWAFFPRQYRAVPKQTYFHMVHYLNTVPAQGSAFTIVPGSHHQTYAATSTMQTADDLQRLKKDPVATAGVDISKGIEICPNEGDLLIFNPMALHSGSGNATDQPRYVYFTSFFDPSAKDLWEELRRQGYRDGFPDSLRNNLPLDLSHLLEW